MSLDAEKVRMGEAPRGAAGGGGSAKPPLVDLTNGQKDVVVLLEVIFDFLDEQ
jgi:hypothetical protein